MKAQASSLAVTSCSLTPLRPARLTAERDLQSCGGGARSAMHGNALFDLARWRRA